MRMFIGLSKTFSKIFASKAEQPAKPSKPASKATECAARKEPADYKLIFSTIEDEHSDIEDEVLRKLAILEDQYDVAIKATPTRGGSRGKGSRPGGKDMKGVAKTGKAAIGVPKAGKHAAGKKRGLATGKAKKGVAKTGGKEWGQPELRKKVHKLSGKKVTTKFQRTTGKARYLYEGKVIVLGLKTFIAVNAPKGVWTKGGVKLR